MDRDLKSITCEESCKHVWLLPVISSIISAQAVVKRIRRSPLIKCDQTFTERRRTSVLEFQADCRKCKTCLVLTKFQDMWSPVISRFCIASQVRKANLGVWMYDAWTIALCTIQLCSLADGSYSICSWYWNPTYKYLLRSSRLSNLPCLWVFVVGLLWLLPCCLKTLHGGFFFYNCLEMNRLLHSNWCRNQYNHGLLWDHRDILKVTNYIYISLCNLCHELFAWSLATYTYHKFFYQWLILKGIINGDVIVILDLLVHKLVIKYMILTNWINILPN